MSIEVDMDSKEVITKDCDAEVAVVRTIAEQSQSNNDICVEQSYDIQSNASPVNKASNAKANKQLNYEEHWQQVAKKHMEEPVFCYRDEGNTMDLA